MRGRGVFIMIVTKKKVGIIMLVWGELDIGCNHTYLIF
jgi:hypothetical protein